MLLHLALLGHALALIQIFIHVDDLKCRTINTDRCCQARYKFIFRVQFPKLKITDYPVESFDAYAAPANTGLGASGSESSKSRMFLHCQDTRDVLPSDSPDRYLELPSPLYIQCPSDHEVEEYEDELLYKFDKEGKSTPKTTKGRCIPSNHRNRRGRKDVEPEAIDLEMAKRLKEDDKPKEIQVEKEAKDQGGICIDLNQDATVYMTTEELLDAGLLDPAAILLPADQTAEATLTINLNLFARFDQSTD